MPFKPPVYQPPGYKERKAKAEASRQRDKNSFYSSAAWKRLRNAHIAANPLCKICLDQETVSIAKDVDHIIPMKRAPQLQLDPMNLQSLCKSCHSRKTATERR